MNQKQKENYLLKNTNLFFLQIIETCNLLDDFGIKIQFLLGWIIFGILICNKIF
jgi:hypothetical protein